MPDRMQPSQERFRDLMRKDSAHTEAEIDELRAMSVMTMGDFDESWLRAAQLRASFELIAAIRRFDESSSELVRRANVISAVVLVFAIIAAVLAVMSLCLSWLSYQHSLHP